MRLIQKTSLKYQKDIDLFNKTYVNYAKFGFFRDDMFNDQSEVIELEFDISRNRNFGIKDAAQIFAQKENTTIIKMLLELKQLHNEKTTSFDKLKDYIKKNDPDGSGQLIVPPKLYEKLLKNDLVLDDPETTTWLKGTNNHILCVASELLDNKAILRPLTIDFTSGSEPEFVIDDDNLLIKEKIGLLEADYNKDLNEQGLFVVFKIE